MEIEYYTTTQSKFGVTITMADKTCEAAFDSKQDRDLFVTTVMWQEQVVNVPKPACPMNLTF